MTGQSTSGAASTHESPGVPQADVHSRTAHVLRAVEPSYRPRLLHASLLRAVLREIRNCASRIGEIRRRRLDLQGVALDPCRELSFPPELRESALACCIEDTRNLYKLRPATTLIDAEVFGQGWRLGVEWGLRTLYKTPRA